MTTGRWALLGTALGSTGLSNPALLIFLPFVGSGYWPEHGLKRQAGGLLAASLFYRLPWAVDLEELESLLFRAYPREFWRRALPGQRTRGNRVADGV